MTTDLNRRAAPHYRCSQLTMADGAANEPACILKVGFLNEHEDELLPQYEAKFDMVILGDQGMEEVQKIVGAVLLGAEESKL
jgi:hypothetical protein